MAKHRIREDKTCLNCGAFVERRYCPNCGQENRESRESFFHLIAEFVTDFVHYDSSFWKTTRYLLFSPARLSLEYMAGKRKSYVNPVKLYIFISFLAFFIPAILPYPYAPEKKKENPTLISEDWSVNINKYGKISSAALLDSIHFSKSEGERIPDLEYQIYRNLFLSKISPNETNLPEIIFDINKYGKVKSVAQLDSIHQSRSEKDRINITEFNIYRSLLKNALNRESAIRNLKNLRIYNEKYKQVKTIEQLDSIHRALPKKSRISKKHYESLQASLSPANNITEKDIAGDDIAGDDILEDSEGEDSIDRFVNDMVNVFNSIDHRDIKGYGRVTSNAQLDSIHYTKASHERLSFRQYMQYKWFFNMRENTNDKHKQEKILEFLLHNLPKFLFVYMPIFALWMWLFNLNRRKYYFDSGIFTLHFFSFWLLVITIFMIISCLFKWLDVKNGWTYGLVLPLMILYITFYFFRGNRVFYKERRWLANIKGIFLLLINTIFIFLVSLIYFLIAMAGSY